MAGADVTITYDFLPTESSIRKSAEKVIENFNRTAGKQKFSQWGSGIYSEKYYKELNSKIATSTKKIGNSFDNTFKFIINLLRATQMRTSLQTKLLSGQKAGGQIFGGTQGGGGGVPISAGGGGAGGGGAGATAGGAGGILGALGVIAGLLVVISVAMTLVSAFFDAVGPIIKVVMKMFSAIILILLMPFLKRGLPILFGILQWMVKMAKGVSELTDSFMTGIEKTLGKIFAGDTGAILDLLIAIFLGPVGLLFLVLTKELIKLVASIDWNELIRKVTPFVIAAFDVLKTAIDGIGTVVFGEETWANIKEGIKLIQDIFSKDGIWNSIKNAINFIGTEIFGEGVWTAIKEALGTATDGVIAKFVSIRDKLGEILTGLITFYNNTLGRYLGRISTVPTSAIDTSNIKTPADALKLGNLATEIARGVDLRGGIASGGGGFSRAGGAISINNSLNVSAGVDKNEYRKILSEFSRSQGKNLRNRTSYFGGAFA